MFLDQSFQSQVVFFPQMANLIISTFILRGQTEWQVCPAAIPMNVTSLIWQWKAISLSFLTVTSLEWKITKYLDCVFVCV